MIHSMSSHLLDIHALFETIPAHFFQIIWKPSGSGISYLLLILLVHQFEPFRIQKLTPEKRKQIHVIKKKVVTWN